jgi:hypothetical protein
MDEVRLQLVRELVGSYVQYVKALASMSSVSEWSEKQETRTGLFSTLFFFFFFFRLQTFEQPLERDGILSGESQSQTIRTA